ncbi:MULTISPECIES: reverse transcriptase domain-containing protein [Tenebrionibacter/Tenebrionicola group]|jgi:RNA-directed DNA polymerase|uniref:Transposase n=2 Tax=Tenebrionibacter/Tenebrionicola group TaxID=2969848 RepID=A0A8K0V179_9ENTR|nr:MULTISPECIES: reverse transcriptase domain-containing protein [Tenebrionibacter/Tenebrionicola group]MBK4715072.1 transposase [Tenebrionibacter intestinalis]MBV5096268.1 transposase [Tenebrionicola larvae]
MGDAQWREAYQWLCRQRRHAPASADVWHLRYHWPEMKEKLFNIVNAGAYRLSPMLIVHGGREARAMWSAQDALVLKWVALHVANFLPVRPSCMHLKGRGVRKSLQALAMAQRHSQFRFVHRTDIRGYYEHIRKDHVASQIERFVSNAIHRDLIKQYLHYSVEQGGEFHTPVTGIPRGCALSPLNGASFLQHIDGYYESLPPEDYFYARYMDDFLLLTRTRWQLRRGIQQLASFFELSGFERHPDKTQTGRIERGFDWLGVWFGADGPAIAPRALQNHRERRVRLFEQIRRKGYSSEEARRRMQAYELRWITWAKGILRAATYPARE